MSDSDKKLDQVALMQFSFKSPMLLAAGCYILEKAVSQPKFWPDEIFFEVIHPKDSNCIGIAFRLLSTTLKVIRKTGAHKKSKTENSNGRIIWEYETIDHALAKAFLKRNQPKKVYSEGQPQLDLFQ